MNCARELRPVSNLISPDGISGALQIPRLEEIKDVLFRHTLSETLFDEHELDLAADSSFNSSLIALIFSLRRPTASTKKAFLSSENL